MKNNLLINLIFTIALITCACTHKKTVTASPKLNSEINFRFDSDRILSKYVPILQNTLDYLRNKPNEVIIIEGHTDYIGTEDYNLDLGDKRARSVKAYLKKHGINPERMISISYGEEKPGMKKFHHIQKNRRVVIKNPE